MIKVRDLVEAGDPVGKLIKVPLYASNGASITGIVVKLEANGSIKVVLQTGGLFNIMPQEVIIFPDIEVLSLKQDIIAFFTEEIRRWGILTTSQVN